MIRATGVGSMPAGPAGESEAEAFRTTVRLVLQEVPDLPFLPEVAARGVHASLTARSLAVLADLGADLQPAGWRLTGGVTTAGADHRRARSLLAQDLDAFEELAEGYAGQVKVQVVGPWTLAATVERPRGDRVLADRGARRDLAQALAEGLRGHVADVRRRVPDAEVLVQVDEPMLPAVLAGRVPTASGFHRHRSVDAPQAGPALEWAFAAVREAGAVPLARCGAPDVPLSLLRGAGAEGVGVDLDTLPVSAYDDLAGLLDAGRPVHLGVVPALEPASPPSDRALTERVLRWLDMLGLDPERAGSLVLTPATGLGETDRGWATRALGLARSVATNLASGAG